MQLAEAEVRHHCGGMDEQGLVELLEPQRLARELLDHLTAMFPVEDAADLLRAMADGLQDRSETGMRDTSEIKGNISSNGKIYQVPGSPNYDSTIVDESKGER